MKSTTKRSAGLMAAAVAICVGLIFLRPENAVAGELRAKMLPFCPTSNAPDLSSYEGLEGIALGIATSFVGSLVDTGVAALKKVVNPDAVTIEDTFREDGLYSYVKSINEKPDAVQLNRRTGCVVAVLGDFGAKPYTGALPFSVEKGKEKDLQSEFSLSAAPTIYFEAAFLQSPDRSAITWLPTRIYVGKFLNSSFWAGRTRSLQITIQMSKPGQDKPFYSQEFKFEGIEEGYAKDQATLQTGTKGAWGNLPAPSSVKPERVVATTDFGSAFDPFNLKVQIVETPKPYKLAMAFADAVDANKAAIKTELNQTIDPSKKEAAALTGQTASLTALTAYITSWQKAADACAKDKTTDSTGQVQCQVLTDQAAVDKAKADAACYVAKVQSCDEKSKLAWPPQKS